MKVMEEIETTVADYSITVKLFKSLGMKVFAKHDNDGGNAQELHTEPLGASDGTESKSEGTKHPLDFEDDIRAARNVTGAMIDIAEDVIFEDIKED